MTKHSTDAVESFYGIDNIVIITMDNVSHMYLWVRFYNELSLTQCGFIASL